MWMVINSTSNKLIAVEELNHNDLLSKVSIISLIGSLILSCQHCHSFRFFTGPVEELKVSQKLCHDFRNLQYSFT